jgi:hypothetical protein
MKKRYCSVDSNTHTHTHTNSEPPYEVEIETYCSKKKRQVLLILQSNHEQKGDIVEGKPVHCNFENVCSKDPPELCLLNALRIETRRR